MKRENFFPKIENLFLIIPFAPQDRKGMDHLTLRLFPVPGEPRIDELRMLNRNRRRKREFPFTNETRKSKLIFMRKLHFQQRQNEIRREDMVQ
ncbi:hypothetical protein TNIN_400881 [Trichonephila inaurata madagascariensis]|uniref:Uncharacterized protein n=1 Tax=Trichonephila inaurata madagascariensis TaxID=2747483 RepID=A0A8X7CQG9_9ARAC|nr:hypothetical protein TNIN_400881 [Trichonephila inaurata madagascariensis]